MQSSMKLIRIRRMYTIADERLSFKIPENINPAEASSVPLAANTAWLALFSDDCLALNANGTASKAPLLIWGGNSTYSNQYSIWKQTK